MIASFADPGRRPPAPVRPRPRPAGRRTPQIVGLSADLAKYTDMHIFRDAHPDRFFQIGMAERRHACRRRHGRSGPSAVRIHVRGVRHPTRADFCLDTAEPALNVNVVGGLPGLTTGYGPSHQATEDLAILRGMPNLTIVDPALGGHRAGRAGAGRASWADYMRLLRGKVPTVLDEYDYHFELGKAAELRTGRDVVLISTGLDDHAGTGLPQERLEADHVDVAVLHVPTIKPLDTQAILRAAADTDRPIVTLENHTIVGGLAESVAATLAFAGKGRRIAPIACQTSSGAGALPTLHDRYGLSTDEVVARIKIELGATAHGHGPWPADDEPPTA